MLAAPVPYQNSTSIRLEPGDRAQSILQGNGGTMSKNETVRRVTVVKRPGFDVEATGLAAELEETFPDAEIKLIESSGGAFEVTVDGQLVFSKRGLGRHAEPGEILNLLADR